MKKISFVLIAIIVIIQGSCNSPKNQKRNSTNLQAGNELIFEKGEKIDNPNFTGNAWLKDLITADSLNQNSVGCVTFEPGTRTGWHSHPSGQIILAIDGIGYYQEKGKPVEIIRKGDVVKCPCNTPHWHGASPDCQFIQIAITGRENGPTVWYKEVTDEEYNSFKE